MIISFHFPLLKVINSCDYIKMSLLIDRIKNNKKATSLGDYYGVKNKINVYRDVPEHLVIEHELLHAKWFPCYRGIASEFPFILSIELDSCN